MNDSSWIVYKHTNRTNGKVYIGITHDIKKRWRGQGCAYKSNRHFWQAIEKYGWDGFDHEIVLSGLTKHEACAEEIRLVAEYRSTDRENGYNHSSGGDIPLVWYRGENHPMYGKHHSAAARAKMSASRSGEKHRCWGKPLPELTRKRISDANKGRKLPTWQIEHLRQINTGKKATAETKQKMSLAHKGHLVSPETRQRIRETKASKPVLQLSNTGELLHKWPSVADAAKSSGLDRSQIRKCCNGILKSSGGFVWAYANEVDISTFTTVSDKQRQELMEIGLRIGNAKQRKEVLQLTLSGELIKIWPSLTQAAKENQMDISSICQCCKGVIKTSGGYIWKYADSHTEM